MATATFVDTAMTAGADSPFNAATDIAEHLVRQGTPFREAHAIVGALVRQSVERGVPLDELVSNDPRLGPEYLVFLEPGSAVRRRTTPGGARSRAGGAQLEQARERIDRQQTWLAHRTLTAAFFDRDALEVAPELLNKVLVGNGVSARLVEVEAYRADDDPGSHAFRGRTPAQRVDVRRAGHAVRVLQLRQPLVHERGVRAGRAPHAVLLRAGRAARRARRDAGTPRARRRATAISPPVPGRLGQAFAVDRALDGSTLLRGPLRIVDDGTPPPARPGVSAAHRPRRGQGRASCPYRFYVPGDPNVSRPPR